MSRSLSCHFVLMLRFLLLKMYFSECVRRLNGEIFTSVDVIYCIRHTTKHLFHLQSNTWSHHICISLWQNVLLCLNVKLRFERVLVGRFVFVECMCNLMLFLEMSSAYFRSNVT